MQIYRNTQASTAAATHCFIYSPSRSIENIFLVGSIKRAPNLDCDFCTQPEKSPESEIIIFDCKEISESALTRLFCQYQEKQPGKMCVLINVDRESSYEKFIDWPLVRGLTYTGAGENRILECLEQVRNGALDFPINLYQDFIMRRRRAPKVDAFRSGEVVLTRREKQILRALDGGQSNKEMAEKLHLSVHTIKTHLYNLYKKVGVKSRLEASTWIRDNLDLIQ